MGFTSVVDPLLSWSLNLPMWLSLTIIAIVLVLIMNLIHKYTTDQRELKRLKEETKKLNQKMKKVSSNPKEAMKIQGQVMDLSKKQMKMSFKSTLWTLIPILFILGWMAVHMAYAPLTPGEEVKVTMHTTEPAKILLSGVEIVSNASQETIEKQASWIVKSDTAGRHDLIFSIDNSSVVHQLVVGEKPLGSYNFLGLFKEQGDGRYEHDAPFRYSVVSYQKATPWGPFSLFGWRPGWLGAYVILTLAFTLISRKLMDIH